MPKAGYEIGSGDGQLELLTVFPTDIDYRTFHWPSVSVEIDDRLPVVQLDLGTGKSTSYSVSCQLFARNNLEREFLAEKISTAFENKRVPVYDFNVDGTSILTYFEPLDVTAHTIRLVSEEGLELFRNAIEFTAKITEY